MERHHLVIFALRISQKMERHLLVIFVLMNAQKMEKHHPVTQNR